MSMNPVFLFNQDYEQFDLANEIDEIEKFLKLVPDDSKPEELSNGVVNEEKQTNGDVSSAGDAVVESTVDESNENKVVENGTHETTDGDAVAVSDETVDSSNVEDGLKEEEKEDDEQRGKIEMG